MLSAVLSSLDVRTICVYTPRAGLSGQVFYDYVNSTMWALLYTSLPIVLLGIYDMDVLPATVLRYPWLYRNGVDDELLTKSFFWGWIAQVGGVCGWG